MWRLFGATAALFVLGVYAGFVLPVPNTISAVQGESTHTYPYLSAVSYTQLPTANSVPTVAASIIENPSALDARFAGMLLHVRWLLERRGGTAVETELNRLDKQILSVMDDVSDDIDDLREDIDEAGGLPSGFVVDNTGTVTAGVWQGTPILDAYINDVLTIGTGSSFANDVVTPNSLLSSGQVDEYCLTYEGTGTTFEWEVCGGGTGLTSTDIDTSSELAAILTDETGTGALVFGTSPTLTGTLTAANANFSGNVGIGTSTPIEKLTVVGNIKGDRFIGYGAGDITENSVVGGNAFISNTTGNYNSASGVDALFSNTVGDGNTAVGYETLLTNDTGSYNTAVGQSALYNNVSGVYNTGVGALSLSNTLGDFNAALGVSAGINLTTGSYNTFLGVATGQGIVTGSNNTIIGSRVLGLSSGLSNNIIIADGEGNQRININEVGNVGIGTTTPSQLFSVGATTGSQFLVSSTGIISDGTWQGDVISSTFLDSAAILSSEIDTSSELATILTDETGSGSAVFSTSPTFTGTVNAAAATFSSSFTLSGSAANIALGSNYLSGDGDDEGIFVDTDGDVGIGTSALNSSKFIVSGSTAQIMRLTSSAAAGWIDFYENSSQRGIIGYGDSGNIFTGAISDSLSIYGFTGLHMGTVSRPSITVAASGYVGIGDTTPTSLFTVGDVTSGDGDYFQINNSGVIVSSNNITPNSIFSAGQADEECLTYEATGTTFEWQTCGAAGLASTDIDTSSELAGILTDETGFSSGALSVFSISPVITGTADFVAGDFSSTLTMSGSAANIALGSNYLSGDGGDEGIYIDSSGNVGIGSTSPSSKLSVSGTSQFTDQVRIGSTFIGNVGARNEKLVVSNYLVDPSISVFTARSRSVVGFTAENAAKYNIGVFAGASVHEANTADWTTLGYPQLVGVSARVDAESGSSGTIERAAGVYSVASAAADSATLKQVAFFQGDAAGTNMTHLAGVYLTGLAHGTYNTGLYLGIAQDALTPTANYGIYDVTGYNSYLSGGLGIGTTTPNQKLTVQGNINLSSATGAIYFDDTKYLYASSTNDSVAFGESAGDTFNSGTTKNVALGFEAGRYASSSVADDSIYIGNQAGYNNAGWSNIFLGRAAGYNGVGYSNFFVGDHAGYSSAGNDNVFMGQDAGRNNLGESGVFIGFSAGANNTGLYNNNFFGYSAGENNSGDENNFFGQNAGYNNGGDGVNAFGELTGYNNSGSYNNFFGRYAGYSNTGNFNEMIGYQTGQNLRSTSTVAVGAEALFGSGGAYSSLNNVALGYRAGYASANGSGNNILVGYRAADNLTTGNNNIVIGYDIDNVTATADNQLNIGNLIFGTGIDGTGTTLSSGNIGIGTTTPGYLLTVAGGTSVTGQLRIGTGFSGNQGNRNEKLVLNSVLTDPATSLYTTRSFARTGFTSDNTGKFVMGMFGEASVDSTNTADWTLESYPQLVGVSGGASAASGSTGLIARAAGIYSVVSAASDSATLDQAALFHGDYAGTNINRVVGMYLTGLGHGTYNTGLYLGIAQDADTPNSNFGIYENTGYNSYLSGNVGVGTTTPTAKLTIYENVNSWTGADVYNINSGIGAFAGFSAYNNQTNGYVDVGVGGTGNTSNSNYWQNRAYLAAGADTSGLLLTTQAVIPIIFGTNATENMRLTSSGNLGIATTTPSARLSVANLTDGNPAIQISGNSTSIANILRFTDYSTFNNVFNVNLNGSATANTNLTNIPLTTSLVAASGSTGGISIVTRAAGAPIIFGAGGASSERMRITGDGDVGIGTTTPTSKLAVVGDINFTGALRLNNTEVISDAGSGYYDILGGSFQMGTAGDFYMNDNLTVYGDNIYFGNGATLSSPSVNKLALLTSGTERLTILPAGNVGIGTTTPLQKLQVFGDIRVGTSGSNGCIEDYGGGVIGGTCSSDERLKENIESLASSTPRSYLEALTALTPVTYNWNEDAAERYSKDRNAANLGLIAQEVEESFPELVSRNNDGFRQVDFRALPFYIIEAVKELWVKVRGIDERVEDLERENEYLKSRLDEIEDEINISPPLPAELVPEVDPVIDTVSAPEPAPQPEEVPTPEPEPILGPESAPEEGV